jgi:hypothetical protein
MLCWPTILYAKMWGDTLYFENYFGIERSPGEELSALILNDINLVDAWTDDMISMKIKVVQSTFAPRKTYTIAGRNIVVDISRIPNYRVSYRRRRV